MTKLEEKKIVTNFKNSIGEGAQTGAAGGGTSRLGGWQHTMPAGWQYMCSQYGGS